MSEPKKILILNGPNINLTGLREKAVYGAKTYDDLLALCRAEAEKLGMEVRCVQSNHEGDLIDALQKAHTDGLDGVVFNPGGYTHTSVAIRDAIAKICAGFDDAYWLRKDREGGFPHDFHAAIAEAGRNHYYTGLFCRLLDEGRFSSMTEIAEAEGIDLGASTLAKPAR